MTADIAFDVRGMPVPQGSARAFVRGDRAVVVTGAGRGPLADWRGAIATEARAAAVGSSPITAPVYVSLSFRFPRPRSHYLPANATRPAPVLRLDAPQMVATRPDIDKLARAALDAITAVVIRDDAQVAVLSATKRYATVDEGPGVFVAIRRLAVTA
jgi:Holliday junction resolvase RusA-like endonuclease